MKVLPFLFAIVACSVLAAEPVVDSDDVVYLSDEPQVSFYTSGWSYANSENPFLLTPDYLTNALVGFSRIAPGSEFLDGGPLIPEVLTEESVQQMLRERLASKEGLEIAVETLGHYNLVSAQYKREEGYAAEYAFPFRSHLFHVLVLAKDADYFSAAQKVARTAIESVESPEK